MSSFVFPGYPAYLEAAAAQIGRPGSARGAGRLVALTALANLCAQASRADPPAVAAILDKAGEFRDHLAVAHRAAEAMLADVAAARLGAGPAALGADASQDAPALPTGGRAGLRKAAKGGTS